MATLRKRVPVAWGTVIFLITVILVFAAIRFNNDIENISSGEVPAAGEFDRRYALHPALAYAHILPGVIYVLLAPFQVSRRFRNRHLDLHRRLGRFLVPIGIVTGVFAIAFGIFFSYGGFAEASATVVFGVYFITALSIAFRSIKDGDIVRHRQWMLRAFAVALGVATIRLWVLLFEATGLLTFEEAFGIAFWIAFAMHALAAEVWLKRRPT